MSAKDQQQIDSLAGKLAALQPSSASGLQAQAFYRAGEQAATLQRKPFAASSRFAGVAVAALILLSSSLSYYAGVSRGEAASELATAPKAAPIHGLEPAEKLPVVELAAESSTASQNNPTLIAAVEESTPPPIPSWLGLPQLSSQEYAHMVEVRTAPSSVSYPVAHPHETDEPIQSMLNELRRKESESPLRRWLSM